MKTNQILNRMKNFSLVITLFLLLTSANSIRQNHVVKEHAKAHIVTTPTYTFNVSAELWQTTQFVLYVNGTAISGTEDIISGSPLTIYDYNAVTSTSTVVVDVTWGHIPTLSVLEGPFPAIVGTVSGSTITFTNVPLTTGGSCGLVLN